MADKGKDKLPVEESSSSTCRHRREAADTTFMASARTAARTEGAPRPSMTAEEQEENDLFTAQLMSMNNEESEEAERLDSESSDDSEYAPASEENTTEDQDQTNEDSPSSRGTGATGKISTSLIPRPSNALSDNPIQVVFHLNPPKQTLSEVFSPQQLSQLGLQSLAQVDLPSNIVTPGIDCDAMSDHEPLALAESLPGVLMDQDTQPQDDSQFFDLDDGDDMHLDRLHTILLQLLTQLRQDRATITSELATP
ncbi:hypothetical protein L7F22_053566 [Adiantum nelumboides]|nr:hypothetical protein [Adiantum nelumboides]